MDHKYIKAAKNLVTALLAALLVMGMAAGCAPTAQEPEKHPFVEMVEDLDISIGRSVSIWKYEDPQAGTYAVPLTKEDVTTSTQQAPYVFESEEEIQYYAYLNMITADESLHPLILEARRIIIYRYSWVTDGVDGWVKDRNGNIIETLPHFSDLFPDDWEIPIESVEVDLSYYGR